MEESLPFYNPWWTKGEMPAHMRRDYRREIFKGLKGYLNIDRVIVIKGPRRVGKTTIMYQLIDELLKGGTDPKSILYLSFDDPKLRVDFDEIIDFYQTNVLKSAVEETSTYILMDEVQYLERWQYFVKKYFDRKYPIKFIVSGSSATLMIKGTESLMGRTIEEVLLPFSFRDFFQYHSKQSIERHTLNESDYLFIKRHEKQARILFKEYLLKGGFPNIFDVKDMGLWQKLIKEDVVDKAIYRDIVSLYGIKGPETLERLFIYLVGITGQILNVSNISRSIGLSREYVKRYVQYLKNAYFLLSSRKYAKSVEKMVRSNEKVYIVDPGIVNSLMNRESLDESAAGHMVETVIARHLAGNEFYYWRNYSEVDFVLKTKKGLLPIEVKFKKDIKRPDYKSLVSFMERFGLKEGVLVTKDLTKEERIVVKGAVTIRIRLIPAWMFLLAV